MRRQIVGSLLIVACSSASESETERAPRLETEPAVAATDAPAASEPAAAEAPSSSPDSREAPRGSVKTVPPILEWQRATCPTPASACPDRCAPIAGWRFEEEHHCYSRVVIACLPMNSDGTYSMRGDLGCWERGDGVVYMGSSTVGMHLRAGWEGCDVSGDFPSAPRCQ